MSSWSPLALAVWLGASSAGLAAEPRPAAQPPAVAPAVVGVDDHLSLDLALRAVGLDGSAATPGAERAEADPDPLARPADAPGMHRLDLHAGRTSRAGWSPGHVSPLYGEVGIDLDPQAALSIVPSYRLVLDEGDRDHAGAIGAQVLKLGARVRF
jgi:hypothetical protein